VELGLTRVLGHELPHQAVHVLTHPNGSSPSANDEREATRG
jgi:hypothetical protein